MKRPFVALAIVLIPAIAAAQARKASSPAPSPAATEARAAERQGRFAEAIRLADSVLAKDPAHREAASVKIDACLAAHDRDAALDVYERFARAARADDKALLAPIARAELQGLSSPTTMAVVAAAAQEQLARSGDPTARANLVKAAKTERDTPRGRVALLALARLGDQDALADLERMAGESHGQARIVALQNLTKASHPGVAPLLRRSLGDRDPMVRVAALEGIAEMRRGDLKEDVRKALGDTVSIVRLSAAVTLRRLGDGSADDVLRQALASEVADVRLLAAKAFAEGPARAWVASIQPVLSNPDGLNRVHAAALLLRDPQARTAARAVLAKATSDSNPATRAEAVRVLAEDSGTAIATLWPLLRDEDENVRLRAAARLLGDADVAASAVPKRSR